MEIWQPIQGFPAYTVSNEGRVRGQRVAVLKPETGHRGHLRVTLWDAQRKRHRKSVHTLVLEAFVSQRPEGQVARHRDGNPANNRVENLQWGTYAENELDKIDHGTTLVGQKNHNAVLTEEAVRYIKQHPEIAATDLADRFAVTAGAVRRIRSGRNWSHIL